MRIAELTGSKPTERFFGPALRRIARMERGYYDLCEYILLISNFGASLCLGAIAATEQGDGAGGNLMDIKNREWREDILQGLANDVPGLGQKLPRIVDANQPLGTVSEYLQKVFEFSPNCQVLPWTGDNPDSLLGMGVHSFEQGIRVLSKGTSETELCLLPQDTYCDPTGAGSVFGAVSGENQNLGINTRVNGTLALEHVKDRHNIESWDDFSAILGATPPGNDGNYMIGLFRPEIVPHTNVPIVEYFGGFGSQQRNEEVRAIVESTAMIKHFYNDWLGPPPIQYLATGGGSVNRDILQVEADVAGVPICMPTQGDSVVNGGCIRAMRQIDPQRYTWEYLVERHCEPGPMIKPNERCADIYTTLKQKLKESLDAELAKRP